MERKAISKRIRFEVFKRDSFTCQYCGQKAPEVVLHVDHITPVAGGGTNEILNLTTSCEGCNLGKGARALSDQSIVEKQRAQIEELQEKHEQIEMLMAWRRGLDAVTDGGVDSVVEYIYSLSNYVPNDNARRKIRSWIKKYGLDEILECASLSFEQYLVYEDDGGETLESWEKAFSFIPRIANSRQADRENPNLKDALYIRGICRNRFNYVDERRCVDIVLNAMSVGVSAERLKRIAKSARSWSQFREGIDIAVDLLDD